MSKNILILDISKYQPVIDYAKVAKEIDGVIIRCGITYWGKHDMAKDIYFEQHYAGFKAQGVPVGVYYYLAADSVAISEREADFCLRIIKGKKLELPVFGDIENNERQGNLSKQLLTDITIAFCSKVQNAGYFVGYYSYTSWLLTKFDTARLNKLFSLWKADYRTNYDKTIACDMHQFTSSGTVTGINGRVDLNNCFVDYETLIKEKGLNGFAANSTPIVKPISDEHVRLKIGFASSGDVRAVQNTLAELGISGTEENGYIITDIAVSAGDQVAILKFCNGLGIPCVEYIETSEHECQCNEYQALIEKMMAEISALRKEKQALQTKYDDFANQLQGIMEKYMKE